MYVGVLLMSIVSNFAEIFGQIDFKKEGGLFHVEHPHPLIPD
jgi:hypothetical protein